MNAYLVSLKIIINKSTVHSSFALKGIYFKRVSRIKVVGSTL